MKIGKSLFILSGALATLRTSRLVALCSVFLLAPHAKADFDESQLPSREGDLAEINGWLVESHQGGRWSPIKGVVEFSRDEEGKGVFLWKKTPRGETQVRVVKTFPATTTDKVLVRFLIKPGTENLGGRLFFTRDIGEDKLMALRFHQGRLHILESGRKQDTDTGMSFNLEEFNKVEIQMTLSEGKAKVTLNGEDAGEYDTLKTQQTVGTMILYGGGEDHETIIKDLSVLSVTDFDQH